MNLAGCLRIRRPGVRILSGAPHGTPSLAGFFVIYLRQVHATCDALRATVRHARSARAIDDDRDRSDDVYCSHMRRTQIYITDEQAARIRQIARGRNVSQAQVIRQILDAALDTGDAEAEARAGILATAGILPDAPDWPQWQAQVRGRSADERLSDEGL